MGSRSAPDSRAANERDEGRNSVMERKQLVDARIACHLS